MDSIPQPSAPAEVSVSDGPSAVASSAVVSEPPVHAEVTQQQTPSTSIGEETTIPSSSTFADQTTADPSISAEPSTVTIGSSAELGSGALHQPEAAQSTVDAGQTTPETSSASQRKPDKHVAAPAAVPSDDPTAQSRPATIEATGDYPEQSDAAPKENEAIDTAPITAPVGFSAETGLPQGSVPVAEDLTVAAPSSTAEASVPSSAPDSGSIVALPSASEAAADQHSTVEAAQGTVQTAEASVSEQFRAAETQGKVSSTPASIPQPSATLTEPQQETAATAPTDARATTSAAAEASSAPTIAPTKSNEVAEPSKQDDASTQKANQVEQSTASASDHPKESATTTVDEAATKSSSSADDVTSELALQLAPASKAVSESTPATPEKKASADGANSAHSDASLPSTPARESKVALILRINKELIRLCVELQSKNLTTEPVYREAAVRLQANLGYLASIADQAGKSVDSSGRATPSGTLPPLEPFPRSEHAPSSPLPALFDKLIALFGSARSSDSPVADGKKRSRDSTADLSADDPRKRAASKGIEQSQDAPKASTPSSTSNLQQQTGLFTTMTPGSALSTTTTTSQREQQSAAPAPHAEQQQSQQPSKGHDLSLAPPVPIAPPTAAQNIPNNPQAQALMQAFGPNALVNLHTLQSHLRGQGTHPWVAYMENNVNGFKAMPLQVQLQHMTSLQNAALQRQKAMGGQGSAAPGSAVGSPATMSNGGQGGVSSPATTRPVSRHSDSPGQAQASPSASAFGGAGPGRTGTPLGGGQGAFQNRPGSSGSVGSMTSAGGRNRTGSSNLAFDPSQLQSAPSPATLGSIGDFAAQQQFGFQAPGLQQGSPAASAGSPSQQQQQQQQQQQGPQQATGMPMSGMPNFQNLPPHLQQQIRQQYMAHMQAQAQAQGGNPQQMSFNPQQQQQQPQQQQQQPQAWNFQSPQ